MMDGMMGGAGPTMHRMIHRDPVDSIGGGRHVMP
jgi:hypothetical protein